jgi:hypothetical protein
MQKKSEIVLMIMDELFERGEEGLEGDFPDEEGGIPSWAIVQLDGRGKRGRTQGQQGGSPKLRGSL